MSLSETSRSGAAPPSQPAYSYPARSNEGDGGRQLQPMLPPMSSLLPRHERMESQPQAHPHSQYAARPFPPIQQDLNQHPLWLSERGPNAPYRADPIVIQNHAQNNLSYQPGQRPPQPQPRQIRRIVQRRGCEPPKIDSSPALPSPLSDHSPYSASRPPSHPASPFQQQGSMTSPASTQGKSSRSMPISGLLSDVPSPEMQKPTVKYSIRMRQEPLAARACGFGERDRRVIDPPPILQMVVEDPTATAEELSALIRQQFNAVVHCTLWDPVSDRDDTAMPGTTDKRQQRRLMGTLVSSPFVGADEHDVEGCFFTFPDLSVRTPGTYSLRFSLMILDPQRMFFGDKLPISSVVFSQAFQVYNAKDFGGMRASTELTKRLKHQGCLISVKKGNAKSGRARGDDDEDEDEDDDDDEELGERRKKPSKRPKR